MAYRYLAAVDMGGTKAEGVVFKGDAQAGRDLRRVCLGKQVGIIGKRYFFFVVFDLHITSPVHCWGTAWRRYGE